MAQSSTWRSSSSWQGPSAGLSGKANNLHSDSRRQTPVRPVYDDFPTAHLSITTGSTKSRLTTAHKDQHLDETHPEGSLLYPPKSARHPKLTQIPTVEIPKLPLKSAKRDIPSIDLPLPPIPVQVRGSTSRERVVSQLDFDLTNVNTISSHPPKVNLSLTALPTVSIAQDRSPIFGGLRSLWGSLKLPGAKLTKPSPAQSHLKHEIHGTEHPPRSPKTIYQPGLLSTENDKGIPMDQVFISNTNEEAPSVKYSSLGVATPGLIAGATSQVLLERLIYNDSGKFHNDDDDTHDAAIILDQNTQDSKEKMNFPVSLGRLNTINTLTLSSIYEGSTVDNIVEQYARSHQLDHVGLDIDDDEEEDIVLPLNISGLKTSVQNSPVHVATPKISKQWITEADEPYKNPTATLRMQRLRRYAAKNSGEAPEVSLPNIPGFVYQQTLHSASEGLGQSSSYGETRDLLDITQRTQTILPNQVGIGIAEHTDKNPYRQGRISHLIPPAKAHSSHPDSAVMIRSTPNHVDYNGVGSTAVPRLALERDVSRALRRESSFSKGSQESSIQNQVDGKGRSSINSIDVLDFAEPEEQKKSHVTSVTKLGFYDRDVIPQTWLGSQQFDQVRVPVNQLHNFPSSTPSAQSPSSESDLPDLASLKAQGEEGNDWETVRESGIGSLVAIRQYGSLGINIGRAGSSIAGLSDDDVLSLVPYGSSGWSSTERILQHPAQIEFSHDYRYREIRKGSIPVMLPSYKAGNLNCFPINSYRSPSNPYRPYLEPLQDSSPPTISKNPNHLFNSSPVVHKSPTRSAKLLAQNKPSRGNLANGTLGSSLEPVGGAFRHVDNSNVSSSVHHWMESFGEPGPTLRISDTLLIKPEDDERPDLFNSYAHIINASDDESFPGHNGRGIRTVGSSIADASSPRSSLGTSPQLQTSHRPYAISSSSESTPLYHGVPWSDTHDREPLVRGPPGAFYHNLRMHPDASGNSSAIKSPKRFSGLSPLPTNELRPISLLSLNRPDILLDKDGHHPNEQVRSRISGFLYRSPLAPIKNKNWQNLYTIDQLLRLGEAAKIDGTYESSSLCGISSRPSRSAVLKDKGAWKRIFVTPRLVNWSHDNSSIRTDTARRKVKVSTIVFLMCCVFPPALALYCVGMLDGIMRWWTKGEILGFSRSHKKWAARLFWAIGICAIIGVGVGLFFRFRDTPI